MYVSRYLYLFKSDEIKLFKMQNIPVYELSLSIQQLHTSDLSNVVVLTLISVEADDVTIQHFILDATHQC